jgi:LDH2 family malate/lactate/ureidoglycolate dehydrogenase
MSCIDVDQFIPIDEFKNQVSEFVESLKNSRKYEGVENILIAGEPEFMTKKKRVKEGIFIDDKNWSLLKKTAEELDVKIYSPHT